MQLDLFDVLYEDFKFSNKPARLVEMFSGIGTQRLGFEKAGIDVDVIAIVEVDKHAVLSYAAMHTDYLEVRDTWFNDKDITKDTMVKVLQDKMIGYDFKNGKHTITDRNNIEIVRDYYLADLLSKNLGDISKVSGSDLPKKIDMITYSFPCQDLSKAGKQKGLSDTRSGLVYQVFRIVEELKEINNKPKTLLMENVVDLIQKKFINEFHEMQFEVEEFGYQNYTFIMNAKDYGVAQNRNRVFMLSVPSEMNYVEPKPFKLEKRLKDYLEHVVDESYYLSDKVINTMSNPNTNITSNTLTTVHKDNFLIEPNAKTELCNKMIANGHLKESDMIRHSYSSERMENIDRVESSNGISATLTTRPDTLGVVVINTLKGNTSMNASMLLIKEATKKGYDEAFVGDSVSLDQPKSKTRRGRVGKQQANTLTTSCNQGVVVPYGGMCVYIDSEHYSEKSIGKIINNLTELDGMTNTITANPQRATIDSGTLLVSNLRIRKLTPLECWRLMGIDDEYFYKAQQVNSNAQLYKQAGNAIVVDVFANIVKSLV